MHQQNSSPALLKPSTSHEIFRNLLFKLSSANVKEHKTISKISSNNFLFFIIAIDRTCCKIPMTSCFLCKEHTAQQKIKRFSIDENRSPKNCHDTDLISKCEIEKHDAWLSHFRMFAFKSE